MSIDLYAQDIYPYLDHGLYGYMNAKGEVKIQPQYAFAKEFSDCDLALVLKPNKSFGYINKEGKYEIKPIYSLASNFKNDKAFIYHNNQFKIINAKGDITNTLPIEITYIKLDKKTGYKGYIVSTKSGHYGVIDHEGNLLIDTVYSDLFHIHETMFAETIFEHNSNPKYRVIDYTTEHPHYDFYGYSENWDTGEAYLVLQNKKTLEKEYIKQTQVKKKPIPFKHKVTRDKNQYYHSETQALILETTRSKRDKFKSVNYKFPRGFNLINQSVNSSQFVLEKDSFIFTPDQNITHIKQFRGALLPVQEIYLNGTWIDPLGEFIVNCRDCEFSPTFEPVRENTSYAFYQPEIYGDLKVKARMRLEVIVNNSDTSTVYSKPYKTRIPSYFNPDFQLFFVKQFINN